MTRGKFVIIGDNYILLSEEFNGDMYWTGHGREVRRRLQKVKNKKDFEKEVEKFDDESFGYRKNYGDKLIYDAVDTGFSREALLDFSEDYFKKWFSDYLYIKNLSEKDIVFTARNWEEDNDTDDTPRQYALKPGKIGIFHFGRKAEDDADDFKNALKKVKH